MNYHKSEHLCAICLALLFAGCPSIVNERIDPSKSGVSRQILNRSSVFSDGSVVFSSGGNIVSTSGASPELKTLVSYSVSHFAPLISPSRDRVVSFRFKDENGYIHSNNFQDSTKSDVSFLLGKMIATPIAFSSTGNFLLLYTYSTDGIGQGVVMNPCVLNLSTGALRKLGDNAVVDFSGTHLLVLKGRELWKSLLHNATEMERVASDLNPLAVSTDGKTAIVTKEDEFLHLLDISTGLLTPLKIAGHTAFFLRDEKEIVVIEGNENSISLVSLDSRRLLRLTNWKAYNTIATPSNGGRFFVFERYEDELGVSRSVFVFDHESGKVVLHSKKSEVPGTVSAE